MNAKEKAVRDAAASLHAAIVDARKAGFAVVWPRAVDGLTSIAISETGKVAPAEPSRAKK